MWSHDQLVAGQASYRDLGEADSEEIARLLLFRAAGESTTLSYDQIRALVRDALCGHLFGIVAEQDGRACGVAIYGLKKDGDNLYGKIITIAVEHEYVGCGIHAGLSDAIERQLEAVGVGFKS